MNSYIQFPLAAAMLAASTLGACASRGDRAESEKVEMNLGDAPQAIRATVEREAAGAKVNEVERVLEDGKVMYVAEFKRDGRATELEMYPDGTVCCVETEINWSELPATLQTVALKEIGGRKVKEVERKLSKGVTTYVVEAKDSAGKVSVELSEAGAVVKKEVKQKS
jgi:hypothetical protein